MALFAKNDECSSVQKASVQRHTTTMMALLDCVLRTLEFGDVEFAQEILRQVGLQHACLLHGAGSEITEEMWCALGQSLVQALQTRLSVKSADYWNDKEDGTIWTNLFHAMAQEVQQGMQNDNRKETMHSTARTTPVIQAEALLPCDNYSKYGQDDVSDHDEYAFDQ